MNGSRQRRAQKPTVLVLATSHLANRGHDVFNAQWNDVIIEKHQHEIHQFIEDSGQYHLEKAGSYF